ncbi:16S rRNA (uracil(1498)-N(3))-methyltransferase [Desulfogranum japonicum]|uniref:16S rRNA (uracil(1498)-N(3))-methyltransferase n=1 Tax=Desulfogranum japonicum TaxID=231447 RepID=UPI000428F6D9|nr:16S rRNA (uracil(1498)-N(3))-methyltransferase [Desulfogranum japonicum]
MNLLLFTQEECDGDRVTLTDRRAEHLIHVLGVKPGDQVRVGQVNGLAGCATVHSVHTDTVVLQVKLTQAPGPGLEVDLVLALPRPIMLQRILKQATVLGVRRFFLIRSNKVEKSFFHSPVLAEDKINSLLLEGLEQAGATHMPEVEIYTRFKPFAQDVLPTLNGIRLLAHPRTECTFATMDNPWLAGKRMILAIGPEGGWNDFEIDTLVKQGFLPFSMGERILHVDTAVVALLAQVQLLFDLAKR